MTSDPNNQLNLPPGKFVNSLELTRLIVRSFSDEELRDLCWEISVDYDSVPGRGKSSKARELVALLERRQRLEIIVAAVLQMRPEFSLDALLTDSRRSLATPTIAPPSVPPVGHETRMISQGFTALIKLLRSPEVRTAVVSFQTDFEAATEQIDQLNGYKLLHDLMQQLENRYFLLYNDQRRLPADDMAWDNIMLNEPDLRAKIDDLLDAVATHSFDATEVRWTRQLEKARRLLRTAVEEFDLDSLKESTRLLFRVLNRHPSRINARLVTTAGNLRLDKLLEALTAVQGKLQSSTTSHSREIVEQIDEGVTAIDELDDKVAQLVREHNALQEIDDELRRVEASLSQGIEELEDAWYDLMPMVEDLCGDSDAAWATGLQKAAKVLDEALEAGKPVLVRRSFRRLRSQASRRFRHVDLELLTLSQELQKIGEPLDTLLRSFQ